MLHLIPPPLHRQLLRTADALRRRWWQLRKPLIFGCRIVVLDGQGRVLLIRQSYGSGRWLAPSGGMKRGEDPTAAALRELREELACGLDGAIAVGTVDEPRYGATNRVHVIAGHLAGEPRPDGREVLEARFFALEALPAHMPDYLRQALPDWVGTFRGDTVPGPATAG